MPDQSPTDDDRKAHEWCDRVEQNPNLAGDKANAAARAIRAHVPAPPKSLADQLRDICKKYSGDVEADLEPLADRVDAVEKEGSHALDEVAAYRDAAKSAAKEGEQRYAEMDETQHELDEARAEVENIRNGLLYNGGCLAPGMTLAEAVENLARAFDPLNPDLLAGDQSPVTASSVARPDPATVPPGEAWIVEFCGDEWTALKDTDAECPWTLATGTRIVTCVQDGSVRLSHRLVPDTRRVMDRPEALDALPVGSVVLDEGGDPWKILQDGFFEGPTMIKSSEELIASLGPVTVIHEGGDGTTRIDDVAKTLADWVLPGVPPEVVARALDAVGHLLPDLPEPEGYVDAVSADGVIDEMAFWGRRVDVEAMRDPRRKGHGAITVFGEQVYNPLELAYQILAACNFIERNQEC